MDSNRYERMVRMLVKNPAAIFEQLTANSINLMHMVVGLVGELLELLLVNGPRHALEELGDLAFYRTGILQHFGLTEESWDKHKRTISMDNYQWPNMDNYVLDLCGIGGEILDQMKKYVIYAKPNWTPEELLKHLCAYDITMHKFLDSMPQTEAYDFSPAGIRQANWDKLAVRYKDQGYTDEAADARYDKVVEESND